MINAIQTDISVIQQKGVTSRTKSEAKPDVVHHKAEAVAFSDERVRHAIDSKVTEIFRIFPNGGVEPEYQNLGLDVVA
jgi:hypothetical protein